jgi:hypothetical protein
MAKIRKRRRVCTCLRGSYTARLEMVDVLHQLLVLHLLSTEEEKEVTQSSSTRSAREKGRGRRRVGASHGSK